MFKLLPMAVVPIQGMPADPVRDRFWEQQGYLVHIEIHIMKSDSAVPSEKMWVEAVAVNQFFEMTEVSSPP